MNQIGIKPSINERLVIASAIKMEIDPSELMYSFG